MDMLGFMIFINRTKFLLTSTFIKMFFKTILRLIHLYIETFI